MSALIKTPTPKVLMSRAKHLRKNGLHDAAHACEQLAFSKIAEGKKE